VSDFSRFVEPGRSVTIKSGIHIGEVGRVAAWDAVMEKWEVDLGGLSVYKHGSELEPMFTMDQVVNVKLAAQQPGTDLADKVKPFGMSSDDLAEFVGEFVTDCKDRIKGVGKQQYSEDGYQKFEIMDLDDLFEYIEEEIRDIPNYCAMLFIRMRRVREALKAIDIIEEKEEEIPSE
jgi:hypothetical protein